MVAQLTRLLLLIQILAAVGIFAIVIRLFPGHSGLAAATSVAVVGAVRLLITANNFFLAHRYQAPTSDRSPLPLRQMVGLFAYEFRASMLSSSWFMPFQHFGQRLVQDSRHLPVLLIHGYSCNSGYWHPMSRALLAAGISHQALDMEPVLGDIEACLPQIDQAVEQLLRASGCKHVVVLAHSMGGLATRAYLRQHGGSRIARVITLGTPHHGTGLANHGAGINSDQMRWRPDTNGGRPSKWITELEQSEHPTTYALFISIYSDDDNIIAPPRSAHLHGAAANFVLRGIGHVSLGHHPAVHAIVVREIINLSAAPLSNSKDNKIT